MKRLTIKPPRLLALTVALGVAQSVSTLAQPQLQPAWPNILHQMEPLSAQERDYQSRLAQEFAHSFKEPKSNEALTAYALANIEAARPLEFIGFQLRALLPNPKWSDRQVEMLLQDLRARLTAEEQRRATEVQKLTAQEGLNTLRVEKFLRLSGQLGEESALVNALPKGIDRMGFPFRKPVDSLGEALTEMGVTQAETRAAILRYATAYEADVVPLIRQVEMIDLVEQDPQIFARRAGFTAANADAGVRELLTRYTTSLAAFKVQRDQKLRLLDQEIGYSKNPRLDAALALLGITDINMTLLDSPPHGLVMMLDYARSSDPVTGEKLERKNMTEEAWRDEMRAKIKARKAADAPK